MGNIMKTGIHAAARLTALLFAILVAACTVVVDETQPTRPGPQFCTREYAPVCAVRNGVRRDFTNACLAANSGFRIIGQGECRRGPQPRSDVCPQVYAPVCAVRTGQRQTFDNPCEAEAQSFQVIQSGQCRRGQRTDRSEPFPPPPSGGVICPRNYAPVCARQGNVIRTFSNECIADGSGFQIIGDGPC
jgi:hypothetical protein